MHFNGLQDVLAFNKINESSLLMKQTTEVKKLTEEELQTVSTIKFYTNLIRDLICILMNLKTINVQFRLS